MAEEDETIKWLKWLEEHAEDAVKGINLAIKDLEKICLKMPNCFECPFDKQCPLQVKEVDAL